MMRTCAFSTPAGHANVMVPFECIVAFGAGGRSIDCRHVVSVPPPAIGARIAKMHAATVCRVGMASIRKRITDRVDAEAVRKRTMAVIGSPRASIRIITRGSDVLPLVRCGEKRFKALRRVARPCSRARVYDPGHGIERLRRRISLAASPRPVPDFVRLSSLVKSGRSGMILLHVTVDGDSFAS